jgi:hypothetical protein
MVWALAIEVEAQIAPTVTSKETSRIIASLGAHALAPLTFNLATG